MSLVVFEVLSLLRKMAVVNYEKLGGAGRNSGICVMFFRLTASN